MFLWRSCSSVANSLFIGAPIVYGSVRQYKVILFCLSVLCFISCLQSSRWEVVCFTFVVLSITPGSANLEILINKKQKQNKKTKQHKIHKNLITC